MSIFILTTFTLVAFAANSLLCRMALGGHLIDPVSFTTIRLVSGAVALIPISRWLGESNTPQKTKGSWASGFALFTYATAFSLAYLSLSTGMGALILFGTVQVTMIGAALKSGEKLDPVQWAGSAAAMGGLIYLVLPGISAPDPLGALLMCVSGIAWGLYSIRGKGASAPVFMTTGNFTRAAYISLVACAAAFPTLRQPELPGVALALTSGIVTSGLGYVLWYKALRTLSIAQASIVQLAVPVLAAYAGVSLLYESVSARLITASVLILGGVALAVIKRKSTPDIRTVFRRHLLGFFLAGLHTALFALITIAVASSDDGETAMLWIIIFKLDQALGLIFNATAIHPTLDSYAFLGGLLWFAYGSAIQFLFRLATACHRWLSRN